MGLNDYDRDKFKEIIKAMGWPEDSYEHLTGEEPTPIKIKRSSVRLPKSQKRILIKFLFFLVLVYAISICILFSIFSTVQAIQYAIIIPFAALTFTIIPAAIIVEAIRYSKAISNYLKCIFTRKVWTRRKVKPPLPPFKNGE